MILGLINGITCYIHCYQHMHLHLVFHRSWCCKHELYYLVGWLGFMPIDQLKYTNLVSWMYCSFSWCVKYVYFSRKDNWLLIGCVIMKWSKSQSNVYHINDMQPMIQMFCSHHCSYGKVIQESYWRFWTLSHTALAFKLGSAFYSKWLA